MSLNRFIFSIKELFSNSADGCLKDNEVNGYYIGPYQRTYKWKSSTINDAVPVLLTDLYDAYLKSASSTRSQQEYFLQYITVKKALIKGEPKFEVIDGQQRLTSLSLLYYALEKFFERENLAANNSGPLVSYARYEDNIFHTITELDETISIPEKMEAQDQYYMLGAFRCFKGFFTLVEEANNLKSFCEYINYNVKIILNKEDEMVSAEEIFSNLNGNKVPLTNAYLVKGLLLTKASRMISSGVEYKRFREIIDERAIMGRTWDEMNAWITRPDISRYFFGPDADGMENLLRLVEKTDRASNKVITTFRSGLKKDEVLRDYDLFNQFHDQVISAQDALECLNEIKHIYKRLKSWHDDPVIYNLLGYMQETSKKHTANIKDLLLKKDTRAAIKHLKDYLYSQLRPAKQIKDLSYIGDKLAVTRILLALSVFPKSEEFNSNKLYRFDFYAYATENWSIEHIFPQNPKSGKLNVQDDKQWLLKKIKKKEADADEELTKKLNQLKENISTATEIDSTYVDWLLAEIGDVNNLGNLALLSGKVNSALSNGFFNTKRKILLRKINTGSFVPKHTLDVFSKMLETKELKDGAGKAIDFDASFVNWSRNDVDVHRSWLVVRLEEILA